VQTSAQDPAGALPESALTASCDTLQAAVEEAQQPRPPEFSDIAIADRLAADHALDWRHVAMFGRSMHWNSKVWVEDRTLRALDLSRKRCQREARAVLDRDDLSERDAKRVAVGIASAKTVAAVLKLSQADRRIAAVPEQFDADPWLLNTPGGIVDLRSGELCAHDWACYCSKITHAAPRAGQPHVWHEFLERVTNGDSDLQDYMQRVAGYCLTGITREHALHFLWGTGANGKSTFLNTLREMLGDYAVVASADTFTEARGERHPTELAALRGARLVISSETEDGRQWAAARIKSLTGGDPIAARFMRQDLFEFVPQFKLVMAGNHKPGLRNVDEAVRRRMHLVPFTAKIPPAERDPRLMERLRDELPQILSWAIDGCLQWQQGGLAPPASVRDATDLYLEDNDTIGAWLAECTRSEAGAFETVAAMHASYHAWAVANGERFLGVKKLGPALEGRGLQRHRTSTAKGFIGLRIVGAGELFGTDAETGVMGHHGHGSSQ
jgi:P4 family phage/plasmid primase-like protien